MCIPCKIIRNAAAAAVSEGESPIPAVAKAIEWLIEWKHAIPKRQRLKFGELQTMGAADCIFMRAEFERHNDDLSMKAQLLREWWLRYETILESKEQGLLSE